MTFKISALNDYPVANAAVSSVISGGVIGGVTALFALVVKTSPLYGLVVGVQVAVKTFADHIIEEAGEKKNIASYKITLIKAAVSVVLFTAGLVTLIALKIVGPVFIGISIGLTVLSLLMSLRQVYNEKRKHMIEELEHQDSVNARASEAPSDDSLAFDGGFSSSHL